MPQGKPTGSIPGWLEAVFDFTPFGAAQDVGQKAGGVAGAIGSIGSTLSGFATAIDWLLHPEAWVRIVCFVAGSGLVVLGVVNFSGVGGQIQGAVGEAAGGIPVVGGVAKGAVSAGQTIMRPAALPIGILEVGLGAVLLFVAFHNLGAANFPELLGVLRDKAQASAAPSAQTLGAGSGGGQ